MLQVIVLPIHVIRRGKKHTVSLSSTFQTSPCIGNPKSYVSKGTSVTKPCPTPTLPQTLLRQSSNLSTISHIFQFRIGHLLGTSGHMFYISSNIFCSHYIFGIFICFPLCSKTILQCNKKCHQNFYLYKTVIRLNLFQYKKLDALNYVYELLEAKT